MDDSLFDSPLDDCPPTATPDIPAEVPRKVGVLRRARVMAALLVLLVLVGANLAIGAGKIQFEKVTSGSMEPNLQIGDVLMSDAGGRIDRGCVVVVEDPMEEGGKLVKRVIGMPGDRVRIRAGIVSVKRLGETRYIEHYSTKIQGNLLMERDKQWLVPDEQLFLMGDNRNNSLDSVDFGPVPIASVKGVVSYIIWPAGRMARVESVWGEITD